MAIKYVGAKRIQGTAAEKPEAYYVSTFSDDMDSSSGWTTVGSGISITGGKLTGTDVTLNGENRIHKAIGTTLSDTAWVLQAKLTIEAPNNNNGYFYPIVISNGNGDFNQATSVDMIFFLVDGSSATGYFRSQDGTTQTNVATGTTHVSTFWIDIIRDGSTMTMKGYTSEANQTSGTTSFNVNFTISGTVSGLDTIQSGASDFNTATQSWSIDWVRIFNGVTTVPAITYPAIATNTIYEETDTAKYKWWDGTSWLRDGSEHGANRGLFMAGYTSDETNVIDYITIATLGNASDIGDLTQARMMLGCCTNGTRACFGGGEGSYFDIIDYVTVLTTANAVDFGNLTVARKGMGGFTASETRGLFSGGENSTTTIDYITIATAGNATDFGDHAAAYGTSITSSLTRALIHIGQSTSDSYNEDVEYVTIDTASNTSDFGDLTDGRNGTMPVTNLTRAVFGGGKYASGSSMRNIMDYVTIATLGNASDFGDLTQARNMGGASSSTTRGCFAGGYSGSSNYNIIDYITIATLGNASDFGDLTTATRGIGGVSDLY